MTLERFDEARRATKPKPELLRHLNDALGFYRQALQITSPDHIGQLAAVHNQLGLICSQSADLERALHHYRESIRYEEAAGNLFGAAQSRRNVAIVLKAAGRLADAREYALAALRNFRDCAGAEEMIQKTLDLISDIARAAGNI